MFSPRIKKTVFKPLLSATMVFVASTSSFAADFTDLMKRIPRSANAIMVIDVAAVHRSPIALKEGWKDRHAAAYVKNPIILPPEADRVVIGAQLNPNSQFRPDWELAMMTLTDSVSVSSIARAEGGYVDKINGVDVVWAPSNVYFAKVSASTLGVMYPANRQAISRWVDVGRNKAKVTASTYLQDAAAGVGAGTQIVLALDLKDVPRPHKVREQLEAIKILKGDAAKIRQWEKTILGLRGITFKVHLGQTAKGTVQIDFSDTTEIFGANAKQIVLESLKSLDASIEELNSWKTTLRSNSIVLEGSLTTSNMRRLFSLLEIPSTKFSTLKGQKPEPENKSAVVTASKKYFKSVSALVNDLRRTLYSDGHKLRSYGLWMEKYARRIDRLPILNVDDELLAWGGSVATSLRSMAVRKRTVGLKSAVRTSNTYKQYDYTYDGNGYYSRNNKSAQRGAIQTQGRAKAGDIRSRGTKTIEDSSAEIRRKMTKKYNTAF